MKKVGRTNTNSVDFAQLEQISVVVKYVRDNKFLGSGFRSCFVRIGDSDDFDFPFVTQLCVCRKVHSLGDTARSNNANPYLAVSRHHSAPCKTTLVAKNKRLLNLPNKHDY